MKEHVAEWFEHDIDSPYMTTVLKFKKTHADKVPAVNHFDNSARLQTVTEKDNKVYYNLIKTWYEVSGVPIILNTSFNDREPIVETPEDAVKCFLNTDIDNLYFPEYGILVSKNDNMRITRWLRNQMFQIAATVGAAVPKRIPFAFDPGTKLEKGGAVTEVFQANNPEKYLTNVFSRLPFMQLLQNINGYDIYRESQYHYTPLPDSKDVVLIGYFQSEKYFFTCVRNHS